MVFKWFLNNFFTKKPKIALIPLLLCNNNKIRLFFKKGRVRLKKFIFVIVFMLFVIPCFAQPANLDGILGMTWKNSAQQTQEILQKTAFTFIQESKSGLLTQQTYEGTLNNEKAKIICFFFDDKLYTITIGILKPQDKLQLSLNEAITALSKSYGDYTIDSAHLMTWKTQSSANEPCKVILGISHNNPYIVTAYLNVPLDTQATQYSITTK